MPHLYICNNGCKMDNEEAPRLVFVKTEKTPYSSMVYFGCGKNMTHLDLEKLPRAVMG